MHKHARPRETVQGQIFRCSTFGGEKGKREKTYKLFRAAPGPRSVALHQYGGVWFHGPYGGVWFHGPSQRGLRLCCAASIRPRMVPRAVRRRTFHGRRASVRRRMVPRPPGFGVFHGPGRFHGAPHQYAVRPRIYRSSGNAPGVLRGGPGCGIMGYRGSIPRPRHPRNPPP